MKYFLGVDGGGTKTIVAIANESGKVIGLSKTDSVDILNVPQEEVKNKLKKAIDESLSKAKIEIEDISFSCFGMSTFGDVPGTEKEIEKIVKDILPKSMVVNDVRVALEGALPKSPGMILLAGTGSMAMAKDIKERIFRVDGWGEYAGDLGSGYFVGRMILQRSFEEYDGRREESPLLKMVKDFANVSDLREILTKCKGQNVRTYIASFSKIACLGATNGIYVASEVISIAVQELKRSVKALLNKLDFEPVKLAYAGGLFNCEYFKNEFISTMKEVKRIEIVRPEFPPYIGSLIMAAKSVLNQDEFLSFYNGLNKNEKEWLSR
ncbi:BadF/BadG/BcrA/BcrD ATPase family protein [Athalassotoga saccharophila]|uniref:BadF/BadG/BcrA/BcrD ATPase family protein n=1 Tax=Athalassotoga saccharophila TaxID=1441386 RepID=UPI00137A1333|nr:BadF/BadG/BcrA/BcrD ATPase family protein [Athalassotoga saccharophila]BBJ28198.1 N-acetylmuramic acid/N-acetylglucosamine kinase [Athalassotoga saccharophila]